ncbi:hypothetical protein QOZ80_4BG0336390 [Eleusine coracana subsp. coracana]|nr:hypothetical protein QOZ80_4BG0336390 [Eleusine coracana subsp. coracana]
MKALHQAPVVGRTFSWSQKSCIFFRSVPYCYSFLHPHQLVASKDTNKQLRLMVNSLSELSSPIAAWDTWKDSSSESPKNILDAEQEVPTEDMDPRFIESIVFDKHLYKYEILDQKNCTVKIMKQQGLMSAGNEDEMLCALNKVEQDILQGKFEWKDGQDVHSNIMEALVNFAGEQAKELMESNKSDRCLFVLKTWCIDCVESIASRIKQIQVALISLAIKNKGLIVTGNQNTDGNTSLESIILPIIKALSHAANDLRCCHSELTTTISYGCPWSDSYSDRCQIEFVGTRINHVIPEILMHLVKTFVSWRHLPSLVANDEVVMYNTFLEKFCPNERTIYGSVALRNCLNTVTYRLTDYFDIEVAKFYLFRGAENVLEMLDLCIKFAEGVTFKESSPSRSRSDAISLVGFLRGKGLCLETSYGVVCRCLKKQLQPGELTPLELQRIGFPCDSLDEIHEARSLLIGKQISLDNQNSFAELLFWCGKLQLDPGSFC